MRSKLKPGEMVPTAARIVSPDRFSLFTVNVQTDGRRRPEIEYRLFDRGVHIPSHIVLRHALECAAELLAEEAA